MVVGDGFEPSKLSRRIYNPIPLATRESHHNLIAKWCRHQESNSGPTDYKSVALPTELYRHIEDGRSSRIRTYDPLLPKQMRYQAALYSDKE